MGSTAMAARLSLVVLVVLVALPCSLARREGGRHVDRTEEERRETRRKLSEQRDPRRGGWSGSGEESRAGEKERRSQSLGILRKPFDKTLSYEDSKIFRDLIKKKIDEKTQYATEKTTKQSTTDEEIKSSKEKVEATTEQIESYDPVVSFENDTDMENDKAHAKHVEIDSEEGSGKVINKVFVKSKQEGIIVNINGRKAVIKKRKRGRRPETKPTLKALSEITKRRILPNSGNKLKSSSDRAEFPRRLSTGGRQYRVKKRRRQGGVTRGQLHNIQTDQETEEITPVMQKQNISNKEQETQLPQQNLRDSFKITNVFEYPSFSVENVKDNPNPSLQVPFHTTNLADVNFAQFDSQFGVLPQRSRPIFRTQTPGYQDTLPNTIYQQQQLLKPQPSPPAWRSMFRGHPAQGIDMDTGAYSFTTNL